MIVITLMIIIDIKSGRNSPKRMIIIKISRIIQLKFSFKYKIEYSWVTLIAGCKQINQKGIDYCSDNNKKYKNNGKNVQ
jgi:hypothetical protein